MISMLDALRTALFHATRPVVALLFRLWLAGAEELEVGPFAVLDMTQDTDMARHLKKLRQAVEKIHRHSPRDYRQVTRSIRRLVVADYQTPLNAEYHSSQRTVLLLAETLRVLDVNALAAMLIHESTHARLDRMGVVHTAGASDRIEAICLRNEIRFLRKLPDARGLLIAKEERYEASPEVHGSGRHRV